MARSIAKMHYPEKNNPNGKALAELFNRHKEFAALRNNIGHAFWGKGTRPQSIRPISMKVQDGKAKARGFSADERDYTLDELEQAAAGITALYVDFQGFMAQSGLGAAFGE